MKICIVKLSAMGDIIHAMVVLQYIKKQLPTAQIDWIVEEGFKGVLANNPHIDTILPINLKSLKKNKMNIFDQLKLLNQYGKNNYDIVIDTQGLIKSAIVSKIVGGRIVGSKIVGFDKNSIREKMASWFYDELVSSPYEKNVILRNCDLVSKALGIVIKDKEILRKDHLLYPKENISTYKNKIVFVVGASRSNKIYPKEKFLKLANLLEKDIIVIWGNEEEKEISQWLSEHSQYISIAPKFTLEELKSVITNASLVIGGDTGPTHMAWAQNTPSLTIFGNTPEYRNTYITKINQVIKSSSKVDPFKLDKEDFSINDIEVNEVYNKAKGLLI